MAETTDTQSELIARAKERAESSPTLGSWGYRIALDPQDVFVGRWRGETTDEDNDDRRIFLFWDQDGQPCFSRFYAALGREIDRASPSLGDRIAVYRGDDYNSSQGTGFAFGVECEPNDDPVPDDDIQF
jgi:hypothetical protein